MTRMSWHAIGHALRQIRRAPALSAAVIGIMALCIGSCVAVFGMIKAVLLTDWVYDDPRRLAIVWHARPNVPGVIGVSPADFQSYRSTLRTFTDIGLVTSRGFNLEGRGGASRITCARMTAGMFPMLGVAPQRGRWFTADEDRDVAAVIVISHRLWLTEFGGDAAILDRDVILDGAPRRVIGVMPEPFVFPPEGVQGLSPSACWIPAGFTAADLSVPSFNHVIVGRLKDGVSWQQAREDAHAGAQKIWAAYPAAVQSQLTLTARVVPLIEQSTGRARLPLLLFAGSVLGLLLIGCANVSNLMLAAFDGRRNDLAIRLSLGASRKAVVAQLLAESLALTIAGGMLGAVVAHALVSAIVATNAAAFPRLAETRIDAGAFAVALLCALIAGIAGGVMPALAASDPDRGARTPSRAIARGFGGSRVRKALIAFELALAVVVFTWAGVLTHSVLDLYAVDPGFTRRAATTFSVTLPDTTYRDADQISGFRDRVLERLARLPGDVSPAAASALPIGQAQAGVVLPAGSTSAAEYRPALVHAVTPEYAKVIGMRLAAGRFIEALDRQGQPVVVLNETLARTVWPSGDAIGRSLSLLGRSSPLRVVGIVRDVRQSGPLRDAAPALYVPIEQVEPPVRDLHFLVDGNDDRLAASIREAVAGVDAAIPVYGLQSLSDALASTISAQRFNMLLVGVFAIFAITLALSGLYAVLAHSVHTARRDFGVRKALGATHHRIVITVIVQAMWPAIGGIAAGTAASIVAAELIASLLFGVRPNDPVTLGGVVMAMLVASIAAVMVPSLRAARVDPASLLRSE